MQFCCNRRYGGDIIMMSAKDALANRPAGSGANLLKGSDLPAKTERITVKALDIRKAPSNFNSPYLLDITCSIPGKTSFPLNISNIQALAELLGDNLEAVRGREVTLRKYLTRNPQQNKMAFGLVVEKVSGKTLAPKPAAKPKAAK